MLFHYDKEEILPREDQIIQFNREVLRMATNKDTPLMERVRYMRIVHSNLTELIERRMYGNDENYYEIFLGFRDLEEEMIYSFSDLMEQVGDRVKVTEPPELHEPEWNEFRQLRTDLYYYIEYRIDEHKLLFATFEDPDQYPMIPVSDEHVYRCVIKLCDIDKSRKPFIKNPMYDKDYIGYVWASDIGSWNVIRTKLESYDFPATDDLSAEFLLLSPRHYALIESHEALDLPEAEYNFPPHQPEEVPVDVEDLWGNVYYEYAGQLIQNPMQSFDAVVSMIDQCCVSDDVHTIGITLYRVAKNSKIVESIEKAIRLGKMVYVYIELTARGDEEQNAEIHQRLMRHAKAGYPVIVNGKTDGVKIHAKMFHATGKRGTIVCTGTGNFNESTAKQYVDLHYITRAPQIIRPIMESFMWLMTRGGYVKQNPRRRAKSVLLREILRETKKGPKGRIRILCNHIYEEVVVNALLDAATCGVKVELTVRTICGLRPGILTIEQSKNFSIRRVVGRFLEHARVYRFGDPNRPHARYYIGSADLLSRNLHRRLESIIRIPDSDEITKRKLDEFLSNKESRNPLATETIVV